MIVFFRGKAATGKSKISQCIKNECGCEVISKDKFFDALLLEGYSWEKANSIAYDKLADYIQKYHDSGKNLVVDVGLAHTPYFNQFLAKMNLDDKNRVLFLFICSDNEVWKQRIKRRIESPEAPNQTFKSTDEAMAHYEKYNIYELEDEILVDSILTLSEMKKIIMDKVVTENDVY